MSKEHPLMPKGKAMALNLSLEYKEGQLSDVGDENPYSFWDEYEKHYAFCIGKQSK